MRLRLLGLVFLALAVSVTLSLTRGQPPAPPGPVPLGSPPSPSPTPAPVPATPAPSAKPARDFTKFNEVQKQMLHSAHAGAEWLFRMNTEKGRFVPGYLPALQRELDADHYLRQCGAAFALARAARFLGEERYAVRATHALLVLLEETGTDPADATVRCTALPSAVVNRVGSAGLLVLAIHELPEPPKDLLDKSDQLCNFLRRQARADGSLACGEGNGPDDPAAVQEYAGLALHGLMRSQQHRPAAWKTDLAAKALAFYRGWWKDHKHPAFVATQTAAWTEAYLLTKQSGYAEFVGAMNDWLCGLQYDRIDPKRLPWHGGFKGVADGRATEAAPDVSSARCAESLAEALRLARQAGDVDRHQRYTDALERCLRFLATLQYSDANTQHFADWYRPRLQGGFFASHQDGNLRLDHTQHAVSALVQYLDQ